MNLKDFKIGSSQSVPYIAVCGGIASGKTTFANLLNHYAIKAILENFQDNPFWRPFYSDPVLHAFETEITFLLQHYHQIKVASNKKEAFVCDFSLLLDLAYADVTLSAGQQDAFLSVYKEVAQELLPPNLIVHLRCGAETELERIKKRGRTVESSITIDYLAAVNNALEQRVEELDGKVNILTIDSEHENFASDERIQEHLISLVQQSLSSRSK